MRAASVSLRFYSLVVLLSALLFAHQSVEALRSSPPSNKNILTQTKDILTQKAIPALIGGVLALHPLNIPRAEALQSGSRAGGASFRSPSVRSSSGSRLGAASSGSTTYYRQPSVSIISPVYSPFGYSPFGYSPFGFSPFSFMPINLNLLILGGVAYAVYSVLSNRAGGSDFSSGDQWSQSTGASVVKLTIALNEDWNDNNNIMQTLGSIAQKNAMMAGRTDLAKLLSETCLALIRKQKDWNSVAFKGENTRGDSRSAEPLFQRLAIAERSKFEKETNASSGPMIRLDKAVNANQPCSTQAVVSILVAVRGSNDVYSRKIRGITDTRQCLEALAADALTDEGDNIMALEILWTPDEKGKE
jgi:uncharacterized membrane protein